MEQGQKDDKLLDQNVAQEVSVKVQNEESLPPPYTVQERGKRAYPTKRVYNWMCSRADGLVNNDERNRNGWLAILLGVPVIMLMTSAVYFLMVMLLWCPTCGHNPKEGIKLNYVNDMRHQLKSDMHPGAQKIIGSTNGGPKEIQKAILGWNKNFGNRKGVVHHRGMLMEILVPKRKLSEDNEYQGTDKKPYKPTKVSKGLASILVGVLKKYLNKDHMLMPDKEIEITGFINKEGVARDVQVVEIPRVGMKTVAVKELEDGSRKMGPVMGAKAKNNVESNKDEYMPVKELFKKTIDRIGAFGPREKDDEETDPFTLSEK